MSRTYRMPRIESLLQAEIADIIRNDLKDPRIGFASVTGVTASRDLRHARVRISVLGDEAAIVATLEALERAAPFVRERLRGKMDAKRIPSVSFHRDDNIAYSAHIAEVINALDIKKEPDGEPDAG